MTERSTAGAGMTGALLVAAAVAAGVFLLAGRLDTAPPVAPELAAAEAQHRLAQLDREQAAAEQAADAEARWVGPRTAARNLAAIAVYTVPIVALAAAAAYGLKHRSVWWPRKTDGALPFPRRLDVTDARIALAGRQAADLALASQQPVPQTVTTTYAPRTDWRNNQEVTGGPELPELPPIAAPAFRDLHLDPRAVHLGTSATGAVQRPWDQLLTLAIGGESGSGKTFTAASLALQAMAAGHRVVLADPHSASDESLAARLAPVRSMLWRPVATTDSEVMASVVAVERVMRDRAEGRDRDLTPITLVTDEFTKLMRGDLAEAIARILEGIAQEGRKLAVRAILLGQTWSAARSGGTSNLRDTIPNVLLHRMRRKPAAMLTGWRPADLPDATTLPAGDCYLLEGEEVVRVSQPRMSEADVAAFAAGLSVQRGSPVGQAQGHTPALTAGVDPPGTDDGPTQDPPADPQADTFARRALELYLAGDDVAEITDALAGTRQRSNGTWKRTRQHVEAAIRAELHRRGAAGDDA